MEIKGKIVNVLPVESGVSKSTGNEWKRQTVILATEGQYPKNVAIILGNALVETIAVGETLDISINIESREYQGRWYTSVNAWKINRPQIQPFPGAYPPVQGQSYPGQPQHQVYSQAQNPYPAPHQPYAEPQYQPQLQRSPVPHAPATAPYVAPSATGFEPHDGDLPF